jgi:hypothetical protein
MPAAATDVPFFITNNSSVTRQIQCGGPWGRTSIGEAAGTNITPGTQNKHFYTAEDNAFSPFGKWRCTYRDTQGAEINSVEFCLARFATDVHLVIPSNRGQLEVQTTTCPPQGPLSPQALIRISGSANNVGDSRPGRSTVKLSGKFNASTPPALDLATVTIEALLFEVEGAGELVSGLPLVLIPEAGSEADEAIYESAPNTKPKARLDVRLNNNKPAEFKLKLEKASIPFFPQQCSQKFDNDFTDELAMRFTIDDGVSTPLVVEGMVEWECKGDDPQLPTELKVQGLLPIEPLPSAP